MRGQADELRGAEDLPGVRGGKVVESEVDAVGPGCPRDIDPVVHDEDCAGAARQLPKLPRERKKLAVRHVFLAKLDEPASSLEDGAGKPHNLGRRPARGGRRADQHHERFVGKRRRALGRGIELLLDGVDVVSERLEPGVRRAEQFRIFFEHAEGLFQAQKVGAEYRGEVAPLALVGADEPGADVKLGVAGGKKFRERDPQDVGGFAQPMTQRLDGVR